MKRIVVISLLLGTVPLACRKQEAPAAAVGSVVRVDFDNAICHIVDKVSQPRAMLIQDNNHQSKLTIMFPSEKDKKNIELAFGSDARCTDACEVSPIDGFSFRVVDGNNNGIQPAFSPDDSFKSVVPHLSTIETLNDNAQKTVPDKKDFRAFFNFNGGTLYARPCESTLKLKTNGIEKNYRAADFVTLSGTTQTQARLEYTKTGEDPWSKLEFTQSTLVWLIFDNAPKKDHENEFHYYLHKKVQKKGQPFPKVVKAPRCFPEPKQNSYSDRGVTVACGNTQWP